MYIGQVNVQTGDDSNIYMCMQKESEGLTNDFGKMAIVCIGTYYYTGGAIAMALRQMVSFQVPTRHIIYKFNV